MGNDKKASSRLQIQSSDALLQYPSQELFSDTEFLAPRVGRQK